MKVVIIYTSILLSVMGLSLVLGYKHTSTFNLEDPLVPRITKTRFKSVKLTDQDFQDLIKLS